MDSDFKFSDHIDSYPPVIPRAKVGKYFPWLSQKRLANLDNLGQGPEHSFRNGRAVLYPTWAFLEWLDERTQPQGRGPEKAHINREQKPEVAVRAKRKGRKTKAQEVQERRG